MRLSLAEQRKKVPEGSATINAIDCSLCRLQIAGADALQRRLALPADSTWLEN